MILRLIATFIVSLFVSIGTYQKDVPSRAPTIHRSGYVINRTENDVITGGYYQLNQNDNPIYQYFLVQSGHTWYTEGFDAHGNGTCYALFCTVMSEGIVDYYCVRVNDDYAVIMEEVYKCFNTYYSATDFFVLDIIQYHWVSPSPVFESWYRLYAIGEQMIGTHCYFEDNYFKQLALLNNYSAPVYLFNSNDFLCVREEYVQVIRLDNRADYNIFFTKDYTYTQPALINTIAWGTLNSFDKDYYLYPFTVVAQLNGNVANYTPFTTSYRLVFGFEYPQNYTYNQGYLDGQNDANSEYYDNGYADGYDNGYESGYDTGFDEGNYSGYNTGYTSGSTIGYNNGYSNGYNTGFGDGVNSAHNYTFGALFGAVADTPIMILRSLLNFDVFGVRAMSILMSMITGSIALFLIRRLIFH